MPPIPDRFAQHFIPGSQLTKRHLSKLDRIGRLLDGLAVRNRQAKAADPVAMLNAFWADPALSKVVIPESTPPASTMRGLCERALMAWGGRRDPQFDYAWRAKQLIQEWDRLMSADDLPAQIREYEVKDRAGAKRVVRALLRRLDRIEGGVVRQDPPHEPEKNPVPVPEATTLPDAQPSADKGDARPKKKKRPPKATVNQRMTEVIEKNPESLLWTVTHWTNHLKCSRAAVHAAQAYRGCREAQEAVKRERMERQRKWQSYKGLNE
jgi:hypothetical protein